MLKVGDRAPKFSLSDGKGNTVSLSDFKDKKVILYFYPRDNTPGCITEAYNIRDNFVKLSKNFIVLGISMDSAESHRKFSEKFNLPFPLLSDPKGDTCREYGVYVEKSMYGKKYWGIQRTTFIIENGKIKNIIEKVDVNNHAKQLMGS